VGVPTSPVCRPRHPQRRGRRSGHLCRCSQGSPLAKKPLPRSEGGSELGAALGNRTPDLRITRGPIPIRTHASCTDTTDHRTGGTRRAGTIQRPVPRTVPRPRPCVTPSCSLCVTSLRGTASRAHEHARPSWDRRLAGHWHIRQACCHTVAGRTSHLPDVRMGISSRPVRRLRPPHHRLGGLPPPAAQVSLQMLDLTGLTVANTLTGRILITTSLPWWTMAGNPIQPPARPMSTPLTGSLIPGYAQNLWKALSATTHITASMWW
jgi:hypothetical protein